MIWLNTIFVIQKVWWLYFLSAVLGFPLPFLTEVVRIAGRAVKFRGAKSAGRSHASGAFKARGRAFGVWGRIGPR